MLAQLPEYSTGRTQICGIAGTLSAAERWRTMLQAAPVPNGIPLRSDLMVENFDEATACLDACTTTTDGAATAPAAAAGAGTAVNLPLDLLPVA